MVLERGDRQPGAQARQHREPARVDGPAAVGGLQRTPVGREARVDRSLGRRRGRGRQPAAGADQDNLDTLVKELNLPPEGFRPTFSVN